MTENLMNENNPPQKMTDTAALEKARKYCAYQERCQQEVRNKLFQWKLRSEQVEGIIAELITEGFLNEERFAEEFARGKFGIKKWGRQKIKMELKQRKVSDYCIKNALGKIDEEDYKKELVKIIKKKIRDIKDTEQFSLKNKLGRYAIQKGYESEIVWEILNDDGFKKILEI
jgi:regulatory protein